MDRFKTIAKFGAEYVVDDYTFKMGIDLHFGRLARLKGNSEYIV